MLAKVMAKVAMLMVAFIVSMIWRTIYENNVIWCINFCVFSGAVAFLTLCSERPVGKMFRIQPRRPRRCRDKPEREWRSIFVGVHIISNLFSIPRIIQPELSLNSTIQPELSFNPTNHSIRSSHEVQLAIFQVFHTEDLQKRALLSKKCTPLSG